MVSQRSVTMFIYHPHSGGRARERAHSFLSNFQLPTFYLFFAQDFLLKDNGSLPVRHSPRASEERTASAINSNHTTRTPKRLPVFVMRKKRNSRARARRGR